MRIENDLVRVEVTEQASEITSFFDKESNVEYMWQGDPAFWKGRNPTLFPMVGSTYSKKCLINGKEYTMGNHGFARNSVFTCVNHTEDTITMRLEENEDTLAQYPFKFTLDIQYVLKGKKLTITYFITNKNDCVMPFNFGLHPAFNCPLEPGEVFSSYRLEFSNPETFKSVIGTFEMNGSKAIPLNYDLFKTTPTIVEEYPKSSYVSLTNGKRRLTVGCAGYRWLAFWTPCENAPFICIEPWHSHGDFEEVNVPFEKREGTICLNAQKTYTTAYTIEIQ